MRARLETLEQLFSTLQTQSAEEAHRTVQSIRSSGVIGAVPSSSSPRPGPTDASTPSPDTQDEIDSSPPLNSPDETTREEASASAPDGQPHHTAAGFGLPDASVVSEAVAVFYDSSGPLFHVFTRAEALALCARVFDSAQAGGHSESRRADVACVAAIAAMGAQYMNGGVDGDLDRRLYEVSRSGFEAVLEQRPLDAIKASALLAMFNCMTKTTTAIAYVGRFCSPSPTQPQFELLMII